MKHETIIEPKNKIMPKKTLINQTKEVIKFVVLQSTTFRIKELVLYRFIFLIVFCTGHTPLFSQIKIKIDNSNAAMLCSLSRSHLASDEHF
jgi:hypothetical protein